MLGKQTLGDLRDQFYCLSEISSAVQNDGFFFIEGVFYVDDRAGNLETPGSRAMLLNIERINMWLNDTRVVFYEAADGALGHENLPLSFERTVIGKVYQKNSPDIRSMHTAVMEELEVSMDTRYLFCHENHCEHYVFFTGFRAHNRACDAKHWLAYPLVVSQMRMSRRRCGVCNLLPAKHVVIGDRLAPESPYYCCDHCEFALHYTLDGDLIYDDFSIFPYVHDVQRG